MTYILSAQRHLDDIEEVRRHWRRYEQYVRDNQAKFPPGAYELATSGWYYGCQDHRAPHDAWLESAVFEEPSQGDRNEVRHLSLQLTLLNAYHDMWIEFRYPRVHSYSIQSSQSGGGHGDWLYDEFRLSEEGHLIHEIEWAGKTFSEGPRWLIEASDVVVSFRERHS